MYSLLNIQISQIASPIAVIFPDGQRQEFASGKEAAEKKYSDSYDVRSIRAVDSTLEITLEPIDILPTGWIGEEQISFF